MNREEPPTDFRQHQSGEVGVIERYLAKFEKRPKPALSHEFGNGSSCNRCECPGLDLHFWRKICKVCACRLDEHDVLRADDQDHGAFVARKLFDSSSSTSSGLSRESLENLVDRLALRQASMSPKVMQSNGGGGADRIYANVGKAPKHAATHASADHIRDAYVADGIAPKGVSPPAPADEERDAWTWAPAGDWRLARSYLISLPESERPLRGSAGAQLRRQRLAQQLPYHDTDVEHKAGTRSAFEQKLHRELVEHIKKQVVGIGEVVDYSQHRAQFAARMPTSGGAMIRPADASQQSVRCRNCLGPFKCTDVGIVTDHERSNGEAIWHPRCFACSVCRQLLVDMLYFYRDGKYFCGRHFGERVYPRCAGCDELIFAREYTFAEEKPWHLEHFCCFGCDRHLSAQRYIVKDEQPFCVECYMHRFARTCQTCSRKIAPFDQRISFGDLHWHADGQCFSCGFCARPLSNEKFLLRGVHPFCSAQCKTNSGFD